MLQKNTFFSNFRVCFILIIGITACNSNSNFFPPKSSPSVTPQLTYTSLPTYTPLPTLTFLPTYTSLPTLTVIPSETNFTTPTPPTSSITQSPRPNSSRRIDFRDGNACFSFTPTGINNQNLTAHGEIKNGIYQFTMKPTQSHDVYVAFCEYSARDEEIRWRWNTVQVDVKVKKGDGFAYGIAVRDRSDDHFILYLINPSKEYCLYRFDRYSWLTSTDILAGCGEKTHSSLRSSEYNTLRLDFLSIKRQIEININGDFIASVDGHLGNYEAGLAVQPVKNSSEEIEVWFDNVEFLSP